jgi:hypothetical protein
MRRCYYCVTPLPIGQDLCGNCSQLVQISDLTRINIFEHVTEYFKNIGNLLYKPKYLPDCWFDACSIIRNIQIKNEEVWEFHNLNGFQSIINDSCVNMDCNCNCFDLCLKIEYNRIILETEFLNNCPTVLKELIEEYMY